jgi:hypothetical protein
MEFTTSTLRILSKQKLSVSYPFKGRILHVQLAASVVRNGYLYTAMHDF